MESRSQPDAYEWRDAESPQPTDAAQEDPYALPLEPVVEGPLAAVTVDPASVEAIGVLEAAPAIEPEPVKKPRRTRAKAAPKETLAPIAEPRCGGGDDS